MAAVLTGGKLLGVGKLVARLPKVGPLASTAVLPAVTVAAKLSGSQLKEINTRARQRHDHLTAALTQFKLDLDQGVTDRLLIRSLK